MHINLASSTARLWYKIFGGVGINSNYSLFWKSLHLDPELLQSLDSQLPPLTCCPFDCWTIIDFIAYVSLICGPPWPQWQILLSSHESSSFSFSYYAICCKLLYKSYIDLYSCPNIIVLLRRPVGWCISGSSPAVLNILQCCTVQQRVQRHYFAPGLT